MNPLEIIEKFYPTSSEIYHVLTQHSLQVQQLAVDVARRHPELELDIEFIKEAAMLHDIGIYLCDAPRIHCFGAHQYIEHGYLGADLLRSLGWPVHALVCERHTGVGIRKETIVQRRLPLPLRDMLPVSLEEQVICYADKFYSKTQLDSCHSLEHIREYLGRFGKWELACFDEWHLRFG